MTEKQTAVEWLELVIKHCKKYNKNIEQKDIDMAKEMEKQQIIDAVDFINNNIILDDDKTGFITTHGDGYYNQTFNK